MLAFSILLPVLAAPIGFLASRVPRYGGGWVLASVPGALLIYFAFKIPDSISHHDFTVIEVYPWVEALNLRVSLVLDSLSLFFVLIITSIGVMVMGYTGNFLANDRRLGLLFCYLLLFMGAMIGLVLAGDVLTLVAFWGLTVLFSFVLVGFFHDEAGARRSAQQTALVTGGGGLLLLVGLLLLSRAAYQEGVSAAEIYTLRAILAAGRQITANALYLPALLLIFIGCWSISAQVPFFFWLPNAMMHAPTPASAYLYSVTMVYAGIYLLARFQAALGTTIFWCTTLTIVGALTMLAGAWAALYQNNAMRLLAYNTVSWFGGLMIVLGSTWKDAALVLMVGITAHAIYQGALVLLIGAVHWRTGSSSLHQPAALHLGMPMVTSLAGGAALSMAGTPLLFGYVARTLLLEVGVYATFDPQDMLPPLVGYGAFAVILVSSTLSLLYSLRLLGKTFWRAPVSGKELDSSAAFDEPPFGMFVGAGMLTGLSLLLSVALLHLVQKLLSPSVMVVAGGEEVDFELRLWNSFRYTFFLGIVPLAGGLFVALLKHIVGATSAATTTADPSARFSRWLKPDVLYDMLDRRGKHAAAQVISLLQGGRLRTYVAMMMVMVLGVVGPVLAYYGVEQIRFPTFSFLLSDVSRRTPEVLAAALISLGIITMLRTSSRLEALTSVGVVGVMVSLFFTFSGAPNLALTQLLIEVLLMAFLLPVFSVMPARFKIHSARWARLRDALFAVAVGGLVATVFLVAATNHQVVRVSSFYLAKSHALDMGSNLVQTILVDFRGIDTLGAVVGVLLALLSVYGLLRFRSSGSGK